MAFLRAVVGVLTCCLMLAAPARLVAAADSAQGRDAFAEGQKLFLAGEYQGALTWFKNGYQQTQDPAFLLNIAQCHRSLGEAPEALIRLRGSRPVSFAWLVAGLTVAHVRPTA